jgi:hypothetical protein
MPIPSEYRQRLIDTLGDSGELQQAIALGSGQLTYYLSEAMRERRGNPVALGSVKRLYDDLQDMVTAGEI